jgi:hypothetical protein
LKLTESQFQKIFEDKRYWRQVWLEIVKDTVRENQRQMRIREASHGPGTVSSSSRVPQPDVDSQIGRASSFPLSEFQQRVRDITDDTINEDADKKVLRTVPRFDSRYEIQTITPSPGHKYLRPEMRNPVQIQRFDTSKDRRGGPEPTDPEAKVLVEGWDRGKQARDSAVRKILVRRKQSEVSR